MKSIVTFFLVLNFGAALASDKPLYISSKVETKGTYLLCEKASGKVSASDNLTNTLSQVLDSIKVEVKLSNLKLIEDKVCVIINKK